MTYRCASCQNVASQMECDHQKVGPANSKKKRKRKTKVDTLEATRCYTLWVCCVLFATCVLIVRRQVFIRRSCCNVPYLMPSGIAVWREWGFFVFTRTQLVEVMKIVPWLSLLSVQPCVQRSLGYSSLPYRLIQAAQLRHHPAVAALSSAWPPGWP